MTDLNKWAAVELMGWDNPEPSEEGWQPTETGSYFRFVNWRRDEDDNVDADIEEWKPTENIEQAMACEQKLVGFTARRRYIAELRRIVDTSGGIASDYEISFLLATATPLQRMTALNKLSAK